MTQPQLNNLGGSSILEARRPLRTSSDTLRSIRQQDTSSFPTSSEARAAYHVTPSQLVSSNKAAPTIPSAPQFRDSIELAGPSDAHIPHLEERKYSEKTPRRETQSSSRRGPSRRELAGRRRNPLREVNLWRWDPMARAGHEHPPGPFLSAHMQQNVLEIMESDPFQWKMVMTTGSGVFAASYAFFVPNMILPALNFVYWPNATLLDKNYKVHLVALAGALLGSLLAGIIADIFGRKQLYRLGPFLLLIGAIGLAGASAGFNNSTMSILGWILFWQFFLGIGVGIEWTLSGVISAEFAPAKHRSRMMATIFLMQPVAYLVVSALVLLLLGSLGRSSGLREEIDHQRAAIAVDKLWRYLVGLGGIPALITLFFRAGMYESPRYSFDLAEEGPVDEVRGPFTMESDIRLCSYFTARGFLRDLGN
ncbi:MFS general substrate transporter [Hyaloscypha bicolor E]|uniref:MFS general substrate transporter n=1 Tax=Hyaloscypha bicolor E TaxID=1095630 RepID=A0A2J6SQC4_9HELO|nr:MFS general substrate transporter [Hyaloscypha bicolor E]PMD52972.1 MFS general substrate transporter [Hyaloscypha bicolor E]